MSAVAHPFSLKRRLLISSLAALSVVLCFAWLVLQAAYKNSLESAQKERMRLQVYVMLGAAEFDGQYMAMPDSLHDPRFDQIQSDLYGIVQDTGGDILWRSDSSAMLPAEVVDNLTMYRMEPGSPLYRHLWAQGLFLYQYPVVWETADGQSAFLFSVLERDKSLNSKLATFRFQLSGWFGLVVCLALVLQFMIIRWGFQPMDQLALDLKFIERGDTDRLSGQYPEEVLPITENLNMLIESERQQRERYRNTLGDLAHSLKTPLAVIRGAGDEHLPLDEYRQLVNHQTSRMDEIVQYQLGRAIKSDMRSLPKPILIEPIVNRMLNALDKVYREKQIQVALNAESAVAFLGDERDLMEVLGNLLENAFKYCNRQVGVLICRDPVDGLVVEIADDGPGVSEQLRQSILERGARVDSSKPGQGIGLSVAVDILSSYNGSLTVRDSAELGGALFRLTLPEPKASRN